MRRPTDLDLRAILAFLRDVYGQADVDLFARRALERLPDVVAGHRVSYNEAHPRLGTLRAFIRPADNIPLLTARHYRDHPMLQHLLRTGDGSAHKFSDFLTTDEFHRTEMYQEHYRLAHVEHQVTICLGPPHPIVVAFAVSRDALDFSERDMLILGLLRPHLRAAYEQAAAAAHLRAHLAMLERAVDAASTGIVLLSRDGRAEFMTRRARHWLREYFPRRGRPSSALPASVADWLARDGAPDRAESLALPAAPLLVTRDDRQLAIRSTAGAEGRALLLEERGAAINPGLLAPLGLTVRETEVLALIAAGATNETIAHAIGAKPRTVAKHVERIHRKLNVENRAAAAARAHAVAAAAERLRD